MAIALPDWPAPTTASPRLLDFGADLVPPLGGAVQRISRLGSRYAIEVEMPPMKSAELGLQWVARLQRGKAGRAVLEFPQPSLTIAAPGAPTVRANTAGGVSLPLTGLTPGFAFVEGQYLSIIHGGRRYLHMITAAVVAAAGGTADVAIFPMLRTNLTAGDVAEINPPRIEGYIEGDELAWVLAVQHYTALSFRITEAE